MKRRGRLAWVFAVALAIGACKSDKKKSGDGESDNAGKTTEPAAPSIDLLPLGVESPRAFSYTWGKGREAYDQAVEAAGVAKPDWAAVAAACDEAIAADPRHLDAHRLAGVARARLGEADKAVAHLSKALAADWKGFGPELPSEQLLAAFFETAEGKALLAANREYEKAFKSAAAGGVLLVAKRGRFKMPAKEGDVWMATRAEIYSYSLETNRYLRLTHSGESIIGYVESPDGSRLAYLRARRYRIAPEADKIAPRFIDARVGVLDADSFETIGKEARLSVPAASLYLSYRSSGELTLQSNEPDAVYSVDADGGNLNASPSPPLDDFETLYRRSWTELEQPVLYADMRKARVLRPTRGVASLGARSIKPTGGVTIELPAGGGGEIRRPSLAPGGARIAFVGVADPCGDKPQSALYVADVATGEVSFVHRGSGLHQVHWLDADRFLFEAEVRELRLYDLISKRATATIKNRANIGFDAVSNADATEHCARQPAAAPPGLETEPDEPEPSSDGGAN